MRHGRKLIALFILALLLPGIGMASAQDGALTPVQSGVVRSDDDLFQTIEVDGYTYTVDSFYLSACFIIERRIRLAEDSIVVLQCFMREGETMVPIETFISADTGIAAHTEVGQPLYSDPQVAVENDQ